MIGNMGEPLDHCWYSSGDASSDFRADPSPLVSISFLESDSLTYASEGEDDVAEWISDDIELRSVQ